MRIFIQERKGIVLRMSARFTDPSALMDDQIDVWYYVKKMDKLNREFDHLINLVP